MMASLSRFTGSLVGAVLGDCIGAMFEGEERVELKSLLKMVSGLEKRQRDVAEGKPIAEKLPFTDDTAMARSVAASLISNNGLNVKDMARRFSEEYHHEPNRGYGGSVTNVFIALRKSPDDVFRPAANQFDGQGSYGNGAAMRIAPAALFCLKKDFSYLKDVTVNTSLLTHSHVQAVQGAVLLSSAVDLALRADPSRDLDRDHFVDQLILRIQPMEEERKKEPKRKHAVELPYCYKLARMKEFLKKDVSVDVIQKVLGTDISALGSVPSAVYSFLRAYKDVPSLQTDNRMKRTILFAIHLGGDTDTIATMAAAIAGALYGYEDIPHSLQACCEGVDDAKTFAKSLWGLHNVPTGDGDVAMSDVSRKKTTESTQL